MGLDNDSLFDQIHSYLLKVRAREKLALETEHKLKQMLQILSRKAMSADEQALFEKAVMHAGGLEVERYNSTVQAKARRAWFRRKI